MKDKEEVGEEEEEDEERNQIFFFNYRGLMLRINQKQSRNFLSSF